jgi:hypothetical protein
MRPRTVLILVVVGVLFVAFATHPKDVGYALGYAAARVAHALHF